VEENATCSANSTSSAIRWSTRARGSSFRPGSATTSSSRPTSPRSAIRVSTSNTRCSRPAPRASGWRSKRGRRGCGSAAIRTTLPAQVAADPAAGGGAAAGRERGQAWRVGNQRRNCLAEARTEGRRVARPLGADGDRRLSVAAAQLAVFEDFQPPLRRARTVAGAIFGVGGHWRQSRPQAVGDRRRARHPAARFRRDDGRARAPGRLAERLRTPSDRRSRTLALTAGRRGVGRPRPPRAGRAGKRRSKG